MNLKLSKKIKIWWNFSKGQEKSFANNIKKRNHIWNKCQKVNEIEYFNWIENTIILKMVRAELDFLWN